MKNFYEDLIKRNIVRPIYEENIKLLLLNAGLLKTNDTIDLTNTEVISEISDHDTSEDICGEDLRQKSNNLINFFEKEF